MPPEQGVAAAREAAGVPAQPPLRFGVMLAGVAVLLPPGVITEFVAQAPVYPVPRAPLRLLGLMQLRGQPVPVFDAAARPPPEVPTLCRRDVLVIGTGAEAAAVAITSAPRALAPQPRADGGARPGSCFEEALGPAHVDPAEPQRTWWLLEPRRLFEILAMPERQA